MKSDKSVKIRLALAYVFLMIGGVFEIPAIQAVGCLVLLFSIMSSPVEKSLLYIMAMVPNVAAYTITGIGSNFLGLSFLLLLFKILANKRMGWTLRITPMCVFTGFYLVALSLLRVLSGNFYDFALICQVIIVVISWLTILKSIPLFDCIKSIEFFRYGCVLMTIGMIFQYLFQEDGIGRFRAVLDDANYTGGVCCILLAIGLIAYCYKLPIKNNNRYILFAILSGLMTGSRGFMLSSAVALFVLLITKSFGKQTSKFIFSFLVLLAAFYGLYVVGFGPAVTVFDNTIGRTMTLEETHNDGDFMDVTSGRTILWAYYMTMALKDPSVFVFGRGFFNYFKEENGGFGLAAHNMYVSSIVGIGVIGTILILLLYFSIIRQYTWGLRRRYVLSIMSMAFAIMICYFFLDGILETRFVTYFAMTVMLMKIYSSKINFL